MCVWHPEADSMIFDSNTLKIVYRNTLIDSYLSSNRSLGITGIKGQGKTFLIKAKRLSLESSYVLLPRDSVMIDTIDEDLRLEKNKLKFLSSYVNWVAIWKVVIIVSILQCSQIRNEINEVELETLNNKTRSLLDEKNKENKPSFVFYSLINRSTKDINCILSNLPKLIMLLSQLHTPIAVFIDKTDQAFSHHLYPVQGNSRSAVGARNSSIWQFSQLSLANASYDIFSCTNQHVKVYYTIRQEALLDAEDVAPNTFRNFSSYIVRIEYTKQDLFEMFRLYIKYENDNNLRYPEIKLSNPEKAFAGFSIIKHGYVNSHLNNEEGLFDYIYRHSLGRAADIQQICRDIFNQNVKNLDEEKIRHSVNASARSLLKQYIAELTPISNMSKKRISDLLAGVTTNVFDKEYLRCICKRYMTKTHDDTCKMNCDSCNEIYPFTRLYNLGLLGYLYKNQSSFDENEQRFVSADRRIIDADSIELENSELYLLHPCISDWAFSIRNSARRNYSNTSKLIVGNTLLCDDKTVKAIQNDLIKLKNDLSEELVFVSSTMKNLGRTRMVIEKEIIKKGYYPVLCENPDYQIDTHVFSHDECIDVVLKCGNIITVFDEDYGGEYSGIKYKDFATKIVELSNGTIEKPSITLMEYYVARSKGKRFLTLMNSSIAKYKDNKDRIKQDDWRFKTDLDKMVCILNFINKLVLDTKYPVPNGNMIKFYSNEEIIESIISSHNFEN